MNCWDSDEERGDRAALTRAKGALTESQANLKLLEEALSKVYSCGVGRAGQ